MKTKITLTVLAAAVALPALAVSAIASSNYGGGDDDRRGSKMMSRMDADSDGAISRAEFLDRRTAMFQRMDTDGNGSLSRDELAAGTSGPGTAAPAAMQAIHTAMMDRRFRAMDSDGDATVSPAEFTEIPSLKFALMDADENGQISIDEIRSGHGRHGGYGMTGGHGGGFNRD